MLEPFDNYGEACDRTPDQYFRSSRRISNEEIAEAPLASSAASALGKP